MSVQLDPTKSAYPSVSTKRNVLLSSSIAFSLAVYPPIQAALIGGTAAITTFLATDAFYYLAIARNSSFGNYTFDGRVLTNGFHPLWQIVLQAVVSHLSVRDGLPPMIASFTLSIIATGLGLAALAARMAFISTKIWPTLLLFPGPYFWFASLIDPRFGSTWSFINGMESPLSILCFGMFFFVLLDEEPLNKTSKLLMLSLASIGILLSRLDDVFLIVAFSVWLAIGQRKIFGLRSSLQRVAIYAVPIGLSLGAYLVFNWRTVGVLLPTSGVVKSDNLALFKNIAWFVIGGVPLVPGVCHYFSVPLPKGISGLALAWRLAQLLIPMGLAVLLLKRRDLLAWISQDKISAFAMLLTYVLLKGGYNLLFVPLMRQGHWYFSLSILIVDVVMILAIVRMVREKSGYYRLDSKGFALLPVALAWIAATSLVWRTLSPTYQNTPNIETLAAGPAIRSALTARLGTFRIIEFDDGIINYALSSPSLSGFGLAADAGTVSALRRGELISYAFQLGYNVIGSVNYSPISNEHLTSDQLREKLRRWEFLRRENDLDRFKFSVAYIDPTTHASFIKFSQR
jgi:hypothetical protein